MVNQRLRLLDLGGDEREFAAEDVRTAARTYLGMVDGPFELNVFTKQVLARALQRVQSERHARLRDAMTLGPTGYKDELKAVAQIDDLLAQLGIEHFESASDEPLPSLTDEIAKSVPKVPVEKPDQVGAFEDQPTLAL